VVDHVGVMNGVVGGILVLRRRYVDDEELGERNIFTLPLGTCHIYCDMTMITFVFFWTERLPNSETAFPPSGGG